MKYLRGGLALERFLPLGVEGADILFLRFKLTCQKAREMNQVTVRRARDPGCRQQGQLPSLPRVRV